MQCWRMMMMNHTKWNGNQFSGPSHASGTKKKLYSIGRKEGRDIFSPQMDFYYQTRIQVTFVFFPQSVVVVLFHYNSSHDFKCHSPLCTIMEVEYKNCLPDKCNVKNAALVNELFYSFVLIHGLIDSQVYFFFIGSLAGGLQKFDKKLCWIEKKMIMLPWQTTPNYWLQLEAAWK